MNEVKYKISNITNLAATASALTAVGNKIELVVNKNKNNYYYNIFLEKGLYKDKSDTQYF